MAAGGVDILQVLPVAFIADGAEALVHHHFGKTDNGVERRADFMADLGEKFRFGDRGLFGCLLGAVKLFCGALPGGDVAQYRAQLFARLRCDPS